jgi:hypothetical protein
VTREIPILEANSAWLRPISVLICLTRAASPGLAGDSALRVPAALLGEPMTPPLLLHGQASKIVKERKGVNKKKGNMSRE